MVSFRSRVWRILVSLAIVSGMPARVLFAQSGGTDLVREAIRSRDGGDFAGAVRLLRQRLLDRPDDGEALRLLAQTLYWLKQPDQARDVYEHALELHPEDIQLRLEYGRMLVETRRDAPARAMLLPLAEIEITRARAEVLLGTVSYWQGDLTTAVRRFREALRADSSLDDARRRWREIVTATAPWLRVEAGFAHDDQTLDRVAPALELGSFLTPLWRIAARVSPAWYRLGDSVVRSVPAGEAALAGYLPALHLETELAGGALHRSFGAISSDWTGRAAVGIRLGGHVTLSARALRSAYQYTVSSLATPVMVRSLAGLLKLDNPRGWLGEASFVRQWYPDGNFLSEGYAWLLAPFAGKQSIALRAGYAFSAQHADQIRFVLANPAQAFQPGDPRFSPEGRYAPYYTPRHLVSHEAIMSVTIRPGSRTTFSGNGSLGLYAREDAASFVVTGAPPNLAFKVIRRAFTPWTIRAGIQQQVTGELDFQAEASHSRTAFYSSSGGAVSLRWRFLGASTRRVDRF